jgi:DNA-binding transcriptional ArsR family regulator
MKDKLSQHRDIYKQALQTQDEQTLLREKTWLTTASAAALLEQDIEAMRNIRACCADLSSLADHFDCTAKQGDSWRTLGNVLTLALESHRPLEQLRLVLPNTVSGVIMQHIKKEAGITPTTLAKLCQKSATHISNELKKLETAGLIDRLKRGKSHGLFLSILGKEALDSVTVAENNKTNSMSLSQHKEASNDDCFSEYANLVRVNEFSNKSLPFQNQ